MAKVNARISELGLETGKNSIALSVANAYLVILFNQEINEVNKANLMSSNEQLVRIRQMVEAGQLPEANLYQIQAQVASDEASVVRSESDIELAYLNLRQLLQGGSGELPDFVIEKPNLDEPNYVLPDKGQVVQHALNTFPEIKQAELGLTTADLNMKIAEGRRLPSLSASFNYGTGFSGANREGVGEETFDIRPIGFVDGSGDLVFTAVPTFSDFRTRPFFDQLESNINRSLFFNVSIPIFNGLANSSNVQQARISQIQAKLTLDDTKNTLRQTVESAHADARAASKNLEAATLALKSQEEAFKYAKIRYEQGVINGVDYTQARSARDASLAEKLRNQYDYIFKFNILEFYQGKEITIR